MPMGMSAAVPVESGERQEAEDVMQQAYLNAFTHLRQLRFSEVLYLADENRHQ